MKDLIIDCFAGGGGASVGIEMALGRPVDIAINHDPEAIRMHKINHPNTLHLTEDIFNVDLERYVAGRHVALMWASPDCTSHSKAKGGQPRKRGLRILPWAVYKHAKVILPDVIIMENVEEIQQWGPLDEKGYPIKEKKGEEYKKFIESLNIPVVTIDNKIADKIPFVTVNGRSAISKAVCEIAESGYEKVIFVCPPLAEKNLENIYVHEERTAGFKEAVKKIHGLEYVIIGNWDYQKQAKKELEKSEKKTAFLCTGDMFALNLIRMFEKNGKRAGQDYGIMGYDNIDFLEYVTPRLTTIDNHVEKVAEEAFNLLLQLMENKNVAETERILETVTVQGETI